MMVLGLNMLFFFLVLYDILNSFFVLSLKIMNMQIRCFYIVDHRKDGLCLCFNLVPS